MRNKLWWHLNRWYLRLVHRDFGCRGEGYYVTPDGIEPCYRKGCH